MLKYGTVDQAATNSWFYWTLFILAIQNTQKDLVIMIFLAILPVNFDSASLIWFLTLFFYHM